MKQGYLLFVVLVGATILGIRSGIADGVLALGYSKLGPAFGWVAGFSKGSADAKTQALNECRINKYNNQIRNLQESQRNCGVAATVHDQCFAISSNGTATAKTGYTSPIGFGLAIAKDSATAAQEAIDQCKSMAGQGGALRDPNVRLRGFSEIATRRTQWLSHTFEISHTICEGDLHTRECR
jgi:hypothetical protein